MQHKAPKSHHQQTDPPVYQRLTVILINCTFINFILVLYYINLVYSAAVNYTLDYTPKVTVTLVLSLKGHSEHRNPALSYSLKKELELRLEARVFMPNSYGKP